MSDVLSPELANALAATVLALHAGVVAFVVLGTLAIVAGGRRRWSWVRNRSFRLLHLAMMLVIAVQAWFGRICPLTVWEQALRNRAGQATYGDSFMQHWLSRLLFFEAPWWAFVVTYTAFLGLVLACWWWVRPRARHG
jgi:hypothetical protein